ncbi:MAG: zf-HC2 domain-containing protein [Pyrinomonadaceae bacterium]
MNERPVCHRAEDLVTYLYGEANEVDALDFREHLHQCEACKSEFAVFNQVHESMLVWRNEALGASFNLTSPASEPVVDSTQFIHHERKLSALAAIREFFKVSPLWLRGATAFAGLLLCVLIGLAVSNSWRQPTQVATTNDESKVFTKAEFDAAVAREVKNQTEKTQQAGVTAPKDVTPIQTPSPRNELARTQKSRPRIKGLTRQEREQLAADLRLIPTTDDDELIFGISDQPNR